MISPSPHLSIVLDDGAVYLHVAKWSYMPGFAMLAGAGAVADRFLTALRAMQHARYDAKLIGAHPDLVAGYTAHSGYPLRVIESPDGWGVIEGAVYGVKPEAVDDALARVARAFCLDASEGREAAERWASSVDGDFLLVVAAPSHGRVLVVNDPLGRLGVFVRCASGTAALSRDVKFFRALGDGIAFDALASAQMLVIGWPLGNLTLLQGVARIPTGSSAIVDIKKGEIEHRRYWEWNFEAMQRSARSTAECVAELVPAFVETCRAQVEWARGRPLLVGLSGGLDSRAVAAGFQRAQADQTAVTFSDASGENADDARVAEQVAIALDVPWRRFQLDHAPWEACEQLVALRDGLNYIGVSHMLQFLEELRNAFGDNACLATGLGGDRILPDLRAGHGLRTLDDLLRHRLAASVWSVTDAAALLGLSQRDLYESLYAHFSAYPEQSMEFRELRFQVMECGLHLGLEGEERDRAMIWSMTPFYAQSFFRKASSVPSSLRRGYQLYSHFLRALNRTAAEIENAEWQAAPTSAKARARAAARAAFRRLPIPLREALRKRFLQKPLDAPASEEYRRRLARIAAAPGVLAVFKKEALDKIAWDRCSRQKFNLLATLMLLFTQSVDTLNPRPVPRSGSFLPIYPT